jgi:hypothetical protein
LGAAAPQRAQHLHGLVEARPTLLEVEADAGVVRRRRPRTDDDQHSTTREPVDRAERLRHGHRPAYNGERHGRRHSHPTRVLHRRRERRDPVEPWHGEDQVVVGGEHREPRARRGLRVVDEMFERVRMAAEVHQRQVRAELHAT